MRKRDSDSIANGYSAIRSAFKAIEYGKQVAVLVPTTVLAEQHERTFRERLADYPFVVESLSRFKTKKAQTETIEMARKGQVDILIGTHRLLSKDVGFKDLGLLIVDEEQRFGVEHKERLKRFRETMDVLTMTATPIPRTLHMSLLGIRDISSLATPPMDRRSIVTQVVNWSDQLIRDAIVRELNRDGQVFFVHNFVHDIQSFADNVRRIVPEARILVGPSQPEDCGDIILRHIPLSDDLQLLFDELYNALQLDPFVVGQDRGPCGVVRHLVVGPVRQRLGRCVTGLVHD